MKPLCRKVRGMLSEYIDNRLSTEDKSLVEHHLQTCEACSKELALLRMTVQLLHRVPEVPVPRSFTITVPAPRRENAFGPASLRWLRPATAIVAIALVVLLMGDFLHAFGNNAGVNSGGNATYAPLAVSSITVGNVTGAGEKMPPAATPAPTQEGAGNLTEGNNTEGNALAPVLMAGVSGTQSPEGPPSIAGREAVGWPLRQTEIGLGAAVFVLLVLMVLARRQRRKKVSAR
jgi:hypothetical protein